MAKGLASALENPPDLILSDVMMRGWNGFGCWPNCASVPRLATFRDLLSARAEKSHVEGLGAGADDYLSSLQCEGVACRVSAQLAMKRRREESEKA